MQEFRKFVWKCAAMTPYRVPHLAGPRVGRRLRSGKESTAGEKASAGEKNAAGKRAPLGRKEKNIRRGGAAGRAKPDVGMEPLLREGVFGRVKVPVGELSDRRKGVYCSRF